jgi:hypothetical protein
MTARHAALLVTVCLWGSDGAAQTPNLSKPQRDLLQALLTAVDQAATQPAAADPEWQTHRMRASDGSHYIAFSAPLSADRTLPQGPALLYVRLANITATAAAPERSLVGEWLAGNRKTPPPIARTGIVLGEMPVMGATGNLSRRPPMSPGMVDLQLMENERRRERERQDARERERRAELESAAMNPREVLPFEDFDFAARLTSGDGARVISRALTAGPGEYALFVAWADPAAPKPAATIQVMRHTLRLPPAITSELTLGSIILADRVSMREAPYPPAEQASHPYSIGAMEIVPAADATFSVDEALSLVFQIINAQPSATGKPDVAVTFRVVRVRGGAESQVATLKPQEYSDTNMPLDFDLRAGHPLFAAVTAPLSTLARGDYRLKITASDRLGGGATSTDVDFRVVGTAVSLLAEAPTLARPFTRDALLERSTVATLIDALAPAAPSAPLSRALVAARGERLVDLLVEEPVPAAERGIRTALTGLALLSVGDASAAVQFTRALQEGAPAAPVQVLLGAARALQGRDPDATAAWEAAIEAGPHPPITRQLLAEALMRRGEYSRAAAAIADAPRDESPSRARLTARTAIGSGRYADAIRILDGHLADDAADADAQWLRLHALYADAVAGNQQSAERFAAEAPRYIDANGVNAALATEWLGALRGNEQ